MRWKLSYRRILYCTLLTLVCYFISQQTKISRINLANLITYDSLADHSRQVRSKIHYTNYLYSDYDKFIKLYNNDVDTIKTAPLDDKCSTFFNQFLAENPDWTFPIYNLAHSRIVKSIDDKEKFIRDKKPSLKETGRKLEKRLEEEYSKAVNVTMEISQNMADTASLMRIYGKCFLDKPQTKLYNQLTELFFPFLTNHLPMFQVVTQSGTIDIPDNTWPIFDKNNKLIDKKQMKTDNIISTIVQNVQGKGIVISGGNIHTRDIMRLIRVLRALNNQYPIQIVHSDLNEKSKRYIEAVAISEIDFLLDPKTSEYKYLKHIDLLNGHHEYGSKYPKQDITFVHIKPCIDRNHKNSFPGYSNKLLALLFTTFEEVIMLDADTVPLVPTDTFFKSKQYKSSGAYFFQDRTLRDYNEFFETNFMSSLFPVNEVSLDSLFNITRVTNKTLNNRYMTGWRHYQEAGVVAINKRQHYLGLLMTLPLSLWKEPVKSMIWGDKEMYWAGLSMAGDENYEFNPNAAASVGQLTTDPKRKYYPNSDTPELCSSHPGHINEEGKLLWINSGFAYCKKNGYYRDKFKFPYVTFEVIELSQLYESPIRITDAIVSPDLPRYRLPGSPIETAYETSFRQSWKLRPKDIDEINNDKPKEEHVKVIEEWGPQRGWIKNDICSGYYYCAYGEVDSYFDAGEKDMGKVYQFNDNDRKMFDYLGKVWYTGGTRRYLQVPKQG